MAVIAVAAVGGGRRMPGPERRACSPSVAGILLNWRTRPSPSAIASAVLRGRRPAPAAGGLAAAARWLERAA
jgi:hypothetical protein